MPGRERGILGVRKDPKNQILFSFNVRDGEEWPSDEDDSDYSPGHVSDSDPEPGTSKSASKKKPVKRQKTSEKRAPTKNKRKRQRVREGRGESSGEGRSRTGQAALTTTTPGYKGRLPLLPTEIWLKIFRYVTQADGAIPFLIRAEKVSKQLREICQDPGLWERVDLSYGWIKFKEASFRHFCQDRLAQCTSLNVSGVPLMAKPAAVKAIADNCKKLRTLNLARCNKLPIDSVITIVNGCSLLEDLDLTSTTADSVTSQTLSYVIEKCGTNLRRLVVSNNLIRGFNSVLIHIMEKCSKLEHLDASNVNFSSGFVTIDIERFQAACPRLRSLGLANSSFRATPATQRVREESPGFPDIEELSLATTDDSASAVVDDVVLRLLKTSERLRLLDMRGCKNAAAVSVLGEIPATDLEQLHLSRSGVTTCLYLHSIIAKWRHSLTDLDLSWNNFRAGVLEQAMVSLCNRTSDRSAAAAPPAMVNLNLAGTRVNMDTVRRLLNSLPNLTSLDLTSCRDVSRGCKREYKTCAELDSLRKLV